MIVLSQKLDSSVYFSILEFIDGTKKVHSMHVLDKCKYLERYIRMQMEMGEHSLVTISFHLSKVYGFDQSRAMDYLLEFLLRRYYIPYYELFKTYKELFPTYSNNELFLS